ncbi:MAG: type III-A CRISPR-associated protein Csm2 [Anaerolineales bacterium]|nr:MAG: type III-A CRISPR-associated protein Csm2 [Anaerolineales bacterium]
MTRQTQQGEGQPAVDVRAIIIGDTKALVDTAKKLGPDLKQGGLTTSQIRNIFGLIKKMERRDFSPDRLLLVKPKLAYAAARHNKAGLTTLKDVLSDAIDVVVEEDDKEVQAERFKQFVNLFEAILAYHREAGGK